MAAVQETLKAKTASIPEVPLLRKLKKGFFLNITAAAALASSVYGGWYLAEQTRLLDLAAQEKGPTGLPLDYIMQGVKYIAANDRPEYFTSPNGGYYKALDPEVKATIYFYKDLLAEDKKTKNYRNEIAEEVLLPSLKIAGLMTLGFSFAVTRSGEVFKKIFS